MSDFLSDFKTCLYTDRQIDEQKKERGRKGSIELQIFLWHVNERVHLWANKLFQTISADQDISTIYV